MENIFSLNKNENNETNADFNNFEIFQKANIDYLKNSITNKKYNNYYIFSFYKDNYGYVLNDKKNNILIGIDFGDFKRSKCVVDILEKATSSKLKYILTTHSHSDHSGGNEDWKDLYKEDLKIISGETEKCKVEFTDIFLKNNEKLSFGNINLKCIHTPGHIQSHVCYLIEDKEINDQSFIFTGDTLFSAGCGRIFSGTYEEMFDSLNKLKCLPDKTLIFCGHEYTLKNLEFALSLDPDNEAILAKIDQVKKAKEDNKNTMGSSIGDEKKYNPFLRCEEKYFKEKFNLEDPVEIFKKIRTLKDKF